VPDPKFQIEIYDKETIGDLSKTLAARLKVEPTLINLFGNTQKLADDSKILMDIPWISSHPIFTRIISSQNQIQILQSNDKMAGDSVPLGSEKFLSSDKYFKRLFQLTDVPIPALCVDVWDLIMRIPTNQQIKNNLLQIQKTSDWANLLDTSNLFRMYYSLQIAVSVCNLAKDFHNVGHCDNANGLLTFINNINAVHLKVSHFVKQDF